MEKIGNDTFEHNGKTYKLIKSPKEGKSCEESCSLYNLGCEELCTKAYYELFNPNFGLIEAVFVEVDESENKGTVMKNDEIDWEKLYKEEHDRYEEMYKAEQMRLEQLASWYGDLPDGDEKQFKKLEEIFPELAGNNDEKDKDEKIRNEIIDYLKRFIPHHEYDLVAQSRIWIDWLENLEKQKETKPVEQNPAWSEEDKMMLECVLDKIGDLGTGEMCKDWLKSLKERYTWRPTEKQMKALGDAIFDAEWDHRLSEMGALLSLDKDLKKL